MKIRSGVLVRRQKIPIPNTQQPQYYTVVDLNIGKSPTIFGRVYTIFDCDKFTRQFLTRLGIYVPEPDLEPTENGDEKSKIVIQTNFNFSNIFNFSVLLNELFFKEIDQERKRAEQILEV